MNLLSTQFLLSWEWNVSIPRLFRLGAHCAFLHCLRNAANNSVRRVLGQSPNRPPYAPGGRPGTAAGHARPAAARQGHAVTAHARGDTKHAGRAVHRRPPAHRAAGPGTSSRVRQRINPRTAGGLSYLRTAGGGADDRPPQRTRKLRKIATSGKGCWIGRGKFYKKYLDHFLIKSNLRSQEVKKGQIFSKSGYFRRKSQLSQ